MSKANSCKIGPSPAEKQSRRDWKAAQKRKAVGTNVQAIPAPPVPGTPAAVKCMPYWTLAMKEAQYLDLLASIISDYRLIVSQLMMYKPIPWTQVNYWNKQIATKEQEYRMKSIALAAQKKSYTDCMRGMPV